MKTNAINLLLLVAIAEMTITKLEQENAQLREHAASHDRLRAAHDLLKTRYTAVESLCRDYESAVNRLGNERHGLLVEVRQLKDQIGVLSKPDDYTALELRNENLRKQLLELGSQNIALAAQAESAGMLEQALDKANRRIDELEAALQVARLPVASRENVIQLVREQAA
ncbi:hypothetical protein [Aquitalea aquatilis]|uniref:hypothetical protein n=1 Tax=Aquitalea aquatilis TaxID=1537400 RepID=UPI0010BDE8EE|nr:hypothetical protein [Aquitalea aquatilis]